MKKVVAILVMAMAACAARAQITYTPTPKIAYCFSAGLSGWIPVLGSASGTALTYTPPADGLYFQNSGTSYPAQCDTSGNLILAPGSSQTFASLTVTGTTTLNGELTGPGHRNVTSPSGTAVTTTLVADQTTWTGTSPGPFTHVTGNTTALTVSSGGTVVAGQSYLLTYSLVAGGTGGVTPHAGSIACTAESATGTYTCWVTASATTAASFTPATGFTGTMTFISLVPQGPAFTSCGTTVVEQGSNDAAGRVTTAASGCVLTFQAAYTNAPSCTVNADNAITVGVSLAVTNTSLTLTASGLTAFSYHCIGLNE